VTLGDLGSGWLLPQMASRSFDAHDDDPTCYRVLSSLSSSVPEGTAFEMSSNAPLVPREPSSLPGLPEPLQRLKGPDGDESYPICWSSEGASAGDEQRWLG
jgi:hypothetical protein